MPLTAYNKDKAGGGDYELVPARNYFGLVCGIYDLGTQKSPQFGPRHQVVLHFELHGKKGPCLDSSGEIFTVVKFCGLTFGAKSTLRPIVETLCGHSFTEEQAVAGIALDPVVGSACRLNVVHEKNAAGKDRAIIKTISPLDDDDPRPTLHNKPCVYEVDPAQPIPSCVPDWIADIIRKSEEFVAVHGQPVARTSGNGAKTVTQEDDDDIPF